MMLGGNRNKITLIADANFFRIGTLDSNLKTAKEFYKLYKIIHILCI